MPIDADATAQAVLASMRQVTVPGDGVYFEVLPFGSLAVSGLAVPMLNVVIVVEHAEPAVLEAALDRLESTGLPYCLQVRPHLASLLAPRADARGLVPQQSIPLLALDEPERLARIRRPRELEINVLRPEEVGVHVAVASAGFEMPESILETLLVEEMFTERGVLAYLGLVEGEPVVTALLMPAPPVAGIANVATLPAHRRRGYAAALTARVGLDALESGADLVWLQSSAAGHNVYRSLGFVDVEEWSCWVRLTDEGPHAARGSSS